MCWGDVGLLLSLPRQGLGNSAIASVADEDQLARYGGRWAAMAITEPEAGSDSAAIRTTAVLDGDEYVLNGEKIYVTAGERAELIVVWATLDRAQGRAAIKSFVVERANPGLVLERLEHKLGIRASDTAAFRLQDCRVPRDALLGSPEIDSRKSFAGAMKTFDNTRPLVAAMAVGVTRACLEHTREALAAAGVTLDDRAPAVAPARRGRPAPAARGRLRGGPPAHPAGRLDGRQRPPELAARLDGQGQGRAAPASTSRWPASSCAAPPATARASCWRSGPATRRSSTSSRARSRSSCSSSPASSWARRAPSCASVGGP